MADSIFDKRFSLRPSAMAAVAERRFADAEALCATGSNARANGAAYLAGFVVEILLKARLVKRYPSIARKRQHELAADEREVWSLIWRRHDLKEMFDKLPQLEAALSGAGARVGQDLVGQLKKVAATWTVYARYSSASMQMADARAFLERVRQLKEYLK